MQWPGFICNTFRSYSWEGLVFYSIYTGLPTFANVPSVGTELRPGVLSTAMGLPKPGDFRFDLVISGNDYTARQIHSVDQRFLNGCQRGQFSTLSPLGDIKFGRALWHVFSVGPDMCLTGFGP